MSSSFQDMLRKARELQMKYYRDEPDLQHRLISGCMTNLTQAMNLQWKVPAHEVKGARQQTLGLVDALHYLLSMLSLRAEAEDIDRLVTARRDMVIDLHLTYDKITHLLAEADKGTVSFAVVDIDGVLFPYPDMLDHFSQNFEGMDPDRIKEMYRLSSIKRNIPPLPGSREFLTTLREKYGLKIVILSSREVEYYPEVYMDTVEFLRYYNLPHDILLFKEEKRGGIILPQILRNTRLFVDDSESQIKAAISSGCKCLIHIGCGPFIKNRSVYCSRNLVELLPHLHDILGPKK